MQLGNYIGSHNGGPATAGICSHLATEEIATHAVFECVPPGEYEILYRLVYRAGGWANPSWTRDLTIAAQSTAAPTRDGAVALINGSAATNCLGHGGWQLTAGQCAEFAASRPNDMVINLPALLDRSV